MNYSLLLLLPAIAFRLSAPAQTTAVTTTGTHDPTYLNQVYFWAPDSLMALEKTPGELKKTRGVAFSGGGTAGYVLEGGRSTARIKASDNIRFAVKVSGMADPSMVIKLYQLDASKKTREATMGHSGMFSKPKNNNIDLNVQKSGTDVYILIPASRLAPGEYGFMNMMQTTTTGGQMSYTFFAFGIDP